MSDDDDDWTTHPHTCKCAKCAAQRRKMQEPREFATVYCVHCADTGFIPGLMKGMDSKPCHHCGTVESLPESEPIERQVARMALDLYNRKIAELEQQRPSLFAGQANEAEDPEDPWKHRSSGMTCATCMWCVEKKAHREDKTEPVFKLARCRRRCPTMNGYPAVFMDDWCGDHKLDENKL